LEIKLNNREIVNKIKRIFREMKRDNVRVPDDMYVTHNYTAATRVRVEVMKAIIKECAKNEERMILNQLCNRPFIRIANTASKVEKMLTFTDLIEAYGHRLEDKDLETANKRAGYKFRGQMEQIIGILKEKEEMN
jgi:hypothetical protein